MLKILIFIVIAVLVLIGASYLKPSENDESNTEEQTSTTPNIENMKIEDIKVGTGAEAKSGTLVSVHYVGTLTNGTKFDSSRDRGEPFQFPLGQGMVIKGWELGVVGMKVGGVRKLTIPPELGYGVNAVGPIPANSTLLFEVELLAVRTQ